MHGAAAQENLIQQSEIAHLSPVTHVVTFPQQKPGLTPLQKWGYGLLLGAFLFGGIQAIRCGVASGIKLEKLVGELTALQQVNQQAQTKHAMLQDKIALYKSPLGVEEMARERLGMVAQDETLVRLYAPSKQQQ